MGRPKTTGQSHNKKSSTYASKRSEQAGSARNRQTTLFDMYKTENKVQEETEAATASTSTANVDEQQSYSVEQNMDFNENQESSLSSNSSSVDLGTESNGDDGDDNNEEGDFHLAPKDGRTYQTVMQNHAYWENEFPFAYYSAKDRGWLCKHCTEFGVGEHWRTKGVKLWEHPNRTFVTHENSTKHKEALSKRQECKRMLTKGNIYRQIRHGQCVQKADIKARNRRIIKTFLKTTYFVVKKKLCSEGEL